ncbi:eukaryotic translation initiation factor 2 subunit 2-like [Lineus longissimus]|uniref:eukaryotic translation initiation factor 2 subunit 2-like n=1 Tax=Lineus longissimus TaxID=88925 RepID=UPI002B4F17A8
MAEEFPAFDPMARKKKKKKKTFDDFEAEDDKKENEGPEESVETKENGEPEQEKAAVDDSDELSFALLKKKPKKKKKAFDMSELQSAVDETENTEAKPEEEEEETVPDTKAVESLDFDFTIKKKKKLKKKIKIDDIVTDKSEKNEEEDSPEQWVAAERDYTYDELLKRVFDIMREKNPEMVAGEKKRLVMKPPQVMRVGTKKTSFANFTEICKMLHRQPKHLLAFLLAELGTSGSIDGNNQLIIKGRFQSKQIENVLRRYIKEYVTCHTCRSPDTILQKDTRLYFLQCETCRSRCSVSSIKSGFQAVTGKRAAIRAKTA